MTTTHSPPAPDKPVDPPTPSTPQTPAADDALRVSSLELQTGLQVSDVAETLTTEDFDSLFGGKE